MCEDVNNGICTVINCLKDAHIACPHCLNFLCYDHADTISSCPDHNDNAVGHFNNKNKMKSQMRNAIEMKHKISMRQDKQ